MNVFDKYQKDDKKSDKLSGGALGTTAMRYLYLESPKGADDKKMLTDKSGRRKVSESAKFDKSSPLFRWAAPLESARQAFPSQSSEDTNKPLKLLNKFASKNFFTMPIREIDDNIRKYTKSPLVIDGIAGALTGAGYWALDRFLNPPNTPKLQRKAEELYQKDGGRRSFEYYMNEANKADRKRRLWYSAAAGLGGAGLAAVSQYNPAYRDSWRKFVPKEGGVYKKASMFGQPTYVSANAVRGAVLANPNINPATKSQIINMMSGIPNAPMSSTDLVNTAIQTGASARAGKPLGRIATAAVADAATAYMAGRVLGVGSPGRLAALAGVGSAAYRYMF